MFTKISGGVCAAQGFKAAGIRCGVKATSRADKNDVALILSDRECTAAGCYNNCCYHLIPSVFFSLFIVTRFRKRYNPLFSESLYTASFFGV